MKKIILFSLFLLIFIGCSSDSSVGNPGNPEPTPVVPPVLVTLATTFPSGNIQFNATVQSLGDGYHERGFCWGYNTNPTKDLTNYIAADGSGTGNFFKITPYTDILDLGGRVYNVRAYAVTGTGIVYGNNLTMTTPLKYSLATTAVKEIYTNRASFKGNVISNDSHYGNVAEKGFCYSTSPNPSLTNGTSVNMTGMVTDPNALGDYSRVVQGLIMNTVYYVRSYGKDYNGEVFYGNEVSFKTAGQIGASGGYVFYDKGETTNGWRYLEAAPNDLTYNGSNVMTWGCYGSIIGQTQAIVGSGLENTLRILSVCTNNGTAAKVCDAYSVNGLNDWFLPSIEELKIFYLSSVGAYTIPTASPREYWSSTEKNMDQAQSYDTQYSSINEWEYKSYGKKVRAIRRY